MRSEEQEAEDINRIKSLQNEGHSYVCARSMIWGGIKNCSCGYGKGVASIADHYHCKVCGKVIISVMFPVDRQCGICRKKEVSDNNVGDEDKNNGKE